MLGDPSVSAKSLCAVDLNKMAWLMFETANHMANNQSFFIHLAKQIATLEGGG